MNIFQFVLYSSDSSSERKVEDRVYERPQNQIILLIQSGCMKAILLAEISFFLFPTEEKDIIYILNFWTFHESGRYETCDFILELSVTPPTRLKKKLKNFVMCGERKKLL